jgi:nicotinate-nucleotide adenylyltransferase
VSRRRRIGVFGGSFDPVHQGHLIMAAEALDRLRLDELLFVPARRPSHKRARKLSPVEHRIAMLRLAVRGEPRFRVSRIEADGDDVNFTVRTLEVLARQERADYYFVMGQDSLEEFPGWHEPDRILALARLAVVPRGEGELSALPPPLRRRAVFLRAPRIGVSSSEIRRRLKRGLSVRYWIPDSVLSYIQRHALYGTRAQGR